ncbi:signal transduction histidine kinase [Streptococcus saliviloxodontae]|uniref:histidine kinase n=2 Tax=Streptococcus saliviloxodontae TaxID=1349416 RepID=A0ABS2PIQ7_9STRE|nr:signal transduction histidine kinase [Streptococcus saliviloxodontae]
MSLMAGLGLLLFMISHFYDEYWNDYDTHRVVEVISKNGYLKDYSNEAVAFVTIDEDMVPTVASNFTELTNKEVKKISLSLLNLGKKKWKWHHFIYSLRELSDGKWQLVFIDTDSYSISSVQNLLVICFAFFSFFLLTGVSIYLSRFITKPAHDAIVREKRFVSDASHELKTPIAAIRANAQVLQQQVEPNRYLDHILSESKRMEHLIQDLLGLSKLDEVDYSFDVKKVNLSAICEEMILSYESLAYEEGKWIEACITEDLFVMGNDAQLKQLVAILLDNAIKYSLTKSKLQITLSKTKRRINLIVSNPSYPYPEEVMENLFERFYQAEDSRNNSQSFGLGLSIAKAIVERHKGTIQAYQEDGSVLFDITLPIV